MRELGDTFATIEGYGRIVIDYGSILSNLLIALLLLFIVHWVLVKRWHGKRVSTKEGGQEGADIQLPGRSAEEEKRSQTVG